LTRLWYFKGTHSMMLI